MSEENSTNQWPDDGLPPLSKKNMRDSITPQDMLEGNAIAQKAWDDLQSQLADAKKALEDGCPKTRVMCKCGFYYHKQEESKCIVCEIRILQNKLAKAMNVLDKYGDHSYSCSEARAQDIEGGYDSVCCSCGLDEAIAKLQSNIEHRK